MIRVLPACVFTCFIGWIILQANQGRNTIFFELVNAIPFGDKLGHFVLFGVLSGLTIIALKGRCLSVKTIQLPLGAVIVFGLAITEELSQTFFINRTFDLLDVFADILGIACSIVITNHYYRRQHSNNDDRHQ